VQAAPSISIDSSTTSALSRIANRSRLVGSGLSVRLHYLDGR